MTRFSLALILLFLAPSAGGQDTPVTDWHPIVCGLNAVEINGKCHALAPPPPQPLAFTSGTITAVSAQCEPGWTLVMDTGHKPQCAWVLKEPIYK